MDLNSLKRKLACSQNVKKTHRIINLFYIVGIGGFLFGYDTGVISGAMSIILQESRISQAGQCG